jgi:hypothetical protein
MYELELMMNQPSNAMMNNKKENTIMADFKTNKRKPNRKVKSMQAPKLDASDVISAGIFEYKMPQALADIILKEDKTKRPHQEVLCDFVNTQYGLKGYCVRVLLN